MYDNLVYVNTEHNNIFKNIFAANELKASSPELSACLTRITLEYFVNSILTERGILEGKPTNINRFLANRKFADFTLAKNINRIEEASKEIRNLMHSIKEIGNHGAHGNEVTYEEAGRNVKQLFNLLEWFSENQLISQALRAECNYILGKCYECEVAVLGDAEESLRYFLLAAEQGMALAQRDIGVCYYNGTGVDKNLSLSQKWLQRSWEQGCQDAGCLLTIINYNTGTDLETVKASFKKLAEQGHVVAKYNYSLLCLRSFAGDEAFRSFKELAAEPLEGPGLSLIYSKLLFKLAECYNMGIGTPMEPQKAFDLFLKLAKRGNADAQYRVGLAYERGKGVPKDYQLAIKWLDKAAQSQHQLARDELMKLKIKLNKR